MHERGPFKMYLIAGIEGEERGRGMGRIADILLTDLRNCSWTVIHEFHFKFAALNGNRVWLEIPLSARPASVDLEQPVAMATQTIKTCGQAHTRTHTHLYTDKRPR